MSRSDLKATIEQLYSTFGDYSGAGNHHCTCGCIKEEDVHKLHSKSLRHLEPGDLVSYHGSALYTWGDPEHYKHYLPRICELISITPNNSYTTIDEVYEKLCYAKWQEWPQNEQQAILNWVLADWIEIANNRESDIGTAELHAYSELLGLKEALHLWDVTGSAQALHNFVEFFYVNGNQILDGGIRLEEKKYESEFACWLFQKHGLIPALEKYYFENEKGDVDHAERISTVLQMIEQQMKAMNATNPKNNK